MPTTIGRLAVRRSIEINAPPERIWREFESTERMRQWYTPAGGVDMPCKQIAYEPRAGGIFETRGIHPASEGDVHFHFTGRVLVFDPPRELTMEMNAAHEEWPSGTLLTFLLTPMDGGRTRVELFHHAFEGFGDQADDIYRAFEGGWTTLQLECIKNLVEHGKAAA